MDKHKALLLLKQKIKEQVPDRWLYSSQVNKIRQMKWRHEKWDKALFREIGGPSIFNAMFDRMFKGGDTNEER
jgi:hypothetical protein